MDYPIHTYRESKTQHPALVLGHANGFPPETYAPLVRAIGGDQHVVCFPARALWPHADPAQFNHWGIMAQDFLGAIQQYELAPVIGIGHSMGATALMMAAVKNPSAFRGLVMIDPVILPRWVLWMKKALQVLRLERYDKLVQGALRRRRHWASVDEAYEQFRGRSLFRRCSDEIVRLYAESITQADGPGVQLRYSPSWEAQYYRTVPTDVWRYVAQLTVSTVIIRGAETNTFLLPAVKLWKKMRPNMPIYEVSSVGHLLPLEEPEQVAEHIKRYIAQWS